ncbi:MAG: HAD family phosphatase [Candidatus Dependentiae bacterium]|nr:HAD family phosphatase [Candidatus Dependentiae bacterium]
MCGSSFPRGSRQSLRLICRSLVALCAYLLIGSAAEAATRTENIVFDFGDVIVINPWDTWDGPGAERYRRIAGKLQHSLVHQLWDEGYIGEEAGLALASKGITDFSPRQVKDTLKKFFIRIFIPESVAIIKQLKERGYRLYLLSNLSRELYSRFIVNNELFKQFDGLFFSFNVGALKPDPRIYLGFFKRFGLKPQECLFIDNMRENVEAGERLGMPGIVYVPGTLERELKKRGVL